MVKFSLLRDTLDLLEEFKNDGQHYAQDIEGFKAWISHTHSTESSIEEPEWEGKSNGRSPESVINTLILHMNRYAKNLSKSAIHNSPFSTQEEFIYLINLRAFGQMTKMELIKKNIHDKTVGIQIINRLIQQGWVEQFDSSLDRRSKIINITALGLDVLDRQMDKIRNATKIVTANLNHKEKMELIRLLTKLDHFHKPFYQQNTQSDQLIEEALKRLNQE